MTLTTTHWLNYAAYRQGPHSTVGNLRILPGVWSPELLNRRDVLVWLPESYNHSDRRYPVLYMQDGQNLFDRYTSFGGVEWAVDETMQTLGAEGLEAIIVGLYHSGPDRIAEYNPFAEPPKGGLRYLEFLTATIKPMIDHDFRTLTDRAYTGILGSSMGGLISLYAFFRRPDVFGLVGALSPSLWIAHGGIHTYVRHATAPHGRIYLDNGTRENNAKSMAQLLQEKGYELDSSLKYVIDEGGQHTESAWARRLPEALRFLLR
jgi:predicted alpha/beta superfamily hydrolase